MAEYVDKGLKKIGITISRPMLALTCIVFGIIVIVFPHLLVWVVGLFLMIQGILLLTDMFEQERSAAATVESKRVYCSLCGTRNLLEATYCKRCGKEIKKAVQNT